MDFLTNLSYNLNPQLYHRENQIARLFVVALRDKNLNGTVKRKPFEDMLTEMLDCDPNFFIRLAKTDVELLIWLMDSGSDIFDKEVIGLSRSLLHYNLDPIIKDQLLELSCKNKYKLKKIFEENSFFVKSFEKKHGEFICSMKSFLKF